LFYSVLNTSISQLQPRAGEQVVVSQGTTHALDPLPGNVTLAASHDDASNINGHILEHWLWHEKMVLGQIVLS